MSDTQPTPFAIADPKSYPRTGALYAPLRVKSRATRKKLLSEEYIATAGSRKRKVSAEASIEARPAVQVWPDSKRTCVRDENAKNVVPTLFQDAEQLKTQSRVAKSSKAKAKSATRSASNARIDVLFKKAQEAAEEKNTQELPAHLAELASLHRAFLKIISLQFAHNGTNVPVDVRLLCPNISRTWGKRTVTVEDLRICIAIEGYNAAGKPESVSPFIISSYGRNKVCIEVDPRLNGASINTDSLCRQFEENIRALGAERAVEEMSELDFNLESLSLADLPQAPIASLGSSTGVNPMLAKGHRALTELKNDIAARQQEKASQAAAIPTTNPDGTKISLLDRIRMKQLAKSQLTLPSGPELQRRAALQRVEDIAATISMLTLANGMPRQAFSMPTILEKLKDSFRTPMSSEEGATCLRLMATEVTPAWIQIVTIGGKENVVIQRALQPVDRVIRERVAQLCS
ncbi:unnamed protein product [Parascedosporium putredinis]|uniref:DNA replication factor Cdt1 C-terminal domain-containing protein n=1 Tax=Parascedosporium putredinis TaxID=1442378 RepID=A0A9P1H4C5_9PEZI|nr:unnamed protein product [Parascedosporium putredinis]CAI7995575.1 unnamed protein product [Parascedosporium putredinis]